jgi:type VI protein secretion system component Hcp
VYDLALQGGSIVQAALPAVQAPAGTRNPIYLQYGGITGSVTQKDFAGASLLDSLQWSVSRDISPPLPGAVGRQVSAPVVSEVAVSLGFDAAFVPLVNELFNGQPTAVETTFTTLAGRTPQPFLKMELNGVLLTSLSANSSGGAPAEGLTLDFSKISLTSLSPAGALQSVTFDTQTGQVT